jgi:hypothetical protein
MPLYRRKRGTPVEAAQWIPGRVVPGVCYGTTDGTSPLAPTAGTCDSYPSEAPAHLHTAHAGQTVHLNPGDWVLPEQRHLGRFYPVKPEDFAENYEPADGPEGVVVEGPAGLAGMAEAILTLARALYGRSGWSHPIVRREGRHGPGHSRHRYRSTGFGADIAMTSEDVESHDGIHVGQSVLVKEESGFHAGRWRLRKVSRITLLRWPPDECKRLGVPPVERFVFLDDGECAGHHDTIVPYKDPRIPC